MKVAVTTNGRSSVATTLVSIAPLFGVRSIFVNCEIGEELLWRDPPFDVVVVPWHGADPCG